MKLNVEFPDDREDCEVICDSWEVVRGGAAMFYDHEEGKMTTEKVASVCVSSPYCIERIE